VAAMTKKEQQKMQRLELENIQLRENHSKHMRVYGDLLIEIIELKAKLTLIQDAINE
jgi:hypothetical protein